MTGFGKLPVGAVVRVVVGLMRNKQDDAGRTVMQLTPADREALQLLFYQAAEFVRRLRKPNAGRI